MEKARNERLKQLIEEVKDSVDKKAAARLELNKHLRLIERLDSFSSECDKCEEYYRMLDEQLTKIYEKKDVLLKEDIKGHKKITNKITSHFQKKHKLVPSGYYMGLFMSMGIGLGVMFGLTIFENNLALGISIGMIIGIAIGTGMDSDAKKKGKVI